MSTVAFNNKKLHKALKIFAMQNETTVTDVVERAVDCYIGYDPNADKPAPSSKIEKTKKSFIESSIKNNNESLDDGFDSLSIPD